MEYIIRGIYLEDNLVTSESKWSQVTKLAILLNQAYQKGRGDIV